MADAFVWGVLLTLALHIATQYERYVPAERPRPRRRRRQRQETREVDADYKIRGDAEAIFGPDAFEADFTGRAVELNDNFHWEHFYRTPDPYAMGHPLDRLTRRRRF